MPTQNPSPSVLPRDGTCLVTPNYPWVLLHSTTIDTSGAAATVTPLTHTNSNLYYSNIIGNPVCLTAESGKMDLRRYFGGSANAAMIQFFGTTTAEMVFGFELYGFKRDTPTGGGYATPIYLCPNTAVLGSMLCDVYPAGASSGSALTNGLWCDTITGTACGPFGVVVEDSGNDRIATLCFDLKGYQILYMRTFADTALAEATTAGAIITCY